MLRKLSNDSENTNLTAIAVAALVGGLAGAFVGLMLAPKSGKELRQDICKKTDDTVNRVENATTQRKEALKQKSDDLLDKGKKLADDLQTFIQESLKLRKPTSITLNADNNTEPAESLPEEPDIGPADPAQADLYLQDN